MPDIQHSALTGADSHEPKGADSAASGTVYVANGAGSGVWTGINTSPPHYGQMNISQNTTALAITAAVDADLYTDSDYAKVTGSGGPWATGETNGVTFSTDELVIAQAGVYLLSTYLTVSHSSANSLVGIKYVVNDTTPYIARTPTAHLSTAGRKSTLPGVGITSMLNAGDTLGLYLASDNTGNVTVHDCAVTVVLLRAT